jgi:hypothetical protein
MEVCEQYELIIFFLGQFCPAAFIESTDIFYTSKSNKYKRATNYWPLYKTPQFLVPWQQLQSIQQQMMISQMYTQILEQCLKYI